MERLSRAARDEHHRRRPPDLRRRHRRRQDGEGRAAHRQAAWDIAELYTEAFLDDMRALNIEPPTVLCRATDHIARADRVHRRHREERLHLPHLRRHLFRHRQAARLRLSRAPRQGRPRSGQAGRARREAKPDRFRAVEVFAARREAADGMGEPVGRRLSRLAHRMLGDGAEVPRRLLRHPLRRRGPHPRPSHQRDRADRGARRHAARQLLDARLLPAARTTPRWRSRPASSCASRR